MTQAFANDPNTMLSPGGEEVVTMQCQMQRTCSPSWKGQTYQAAGLAQGVSVMRQNGLTGPISLECATYANNYNGWLMYKPTDSLNPSRLLAEVHVYGGNAVHTPAQENSNFLPVIQAGYPLIYGEVGETYNASSCANTFTGRIGWDDQKAAGSRRGRGRQRRGAAVCWPIRRRACRTGRRRSARLTRRRGRGGCSTT
jgi:hypothetical protein